MRYRKIGSWLFNHRVAIFPSLLIAWLIIMTIFQISGSSIGIYHTYLYGDAKDPNLLYGKPQSIRSDEWLVNTQMTIAQQQNDFQRINPSFSEPKDMSLLFDAPYLEWSAAFKPQNFSFFILPFLNAFAFKWWVMLIGLMLSAYFFCLKLLPKNVWVAIASSIIITCSPFVFWWYLSGTILTLTYGFLILMLGMSLIDKKPIRFFNKTLGQTTSSIVKSATLTYILICFALLFYPPFQIPVALVIFFFLIGYLLNSTKKWSLKGVAITLLPFIISGIVVGGVTAVYLLTRSDTIHAITHTVYPGKRTVASGGYDGKKLLTTYLQPQLQRDGRGDKYDKNQSESSNFILLPIFFILPAISFLIWLYSKKRRIDWLLLSLTLCSFIFLAQLFIPGVDPLTKFFLLGIVPLERLVIGLGFLGVLLVICLIKLKEQYIKVFNRRILWGILAYSALFFLCTLWAGFEISKAYPDFISSKKLILLLASILMIGYVLILINRVRLGLTVIALFAIASVIHIHPLYRGLGPWYENQVTATIKEVSHPDDTWAAGQNIVIENIPQISDRRAVSGVTGYPSNTFWREHSDMKEDTIYNRYAHTIFSTNNDAPLILVGPDLFAISLSCSRPVTREIDYLISTTPIGESCYQPVETVRYPHMNFYIYRVVPSTH